MCMPLSIEKEDWLWYNNDFNLETDAYKQSRDIFEANYTDMSDRVRMKILEEYGRDSRNNPIA